MTFHDAEDGSGRHILSLGIIVGNGEAFVEEHFLGRLLLELLIGGHEGTGLLGIEPVGFVLVE